MIEARGLIKRYGSTLAVDDLSFTIRPGLVTGFLGPNGAGKTTTMRLILGLDYPAAGTVTVNGLPYPKLASPMREVGALLDARAVHGGRSAYNHLLCLAQTNDIPRRRVDEVLGIVGLAGVARKRSKGFSLGMSQRLGIAAALLGDPAILMFDEPVNGLDPEGILWIRTLMRSLATEGRTVLVSSHLMSEMENTADHLLVVGRGRLIADCGMAEFIARSSGQTVLVRTRDPEALARAVIAAGASVRAAGAADSGTADSTSADGAAAGGGGPAELEVSGLTEEQVGTIALANGIALAHLAPSRASLEQAFMELTADSVDYHAGPAAGQLTHTGPARGDEESLTWQR
jgi:ABC-2 type transport system ATP-binding protein